MKEIAKLFLKLGILGFGGPLATISMMEEEVVKKRGWISQDEFSKNFALLKIFPGPTATQLAIRLGSLRRGFWGGVVAGVLFILPSFISILFLGIFLDRVSGSVFKEKFILGMQISALAVISMGAFRLAKTNIKKDISILIAMVSFLLMLFWPGLEPFIIISSGIMGVLLLWRQNLKFEGASFLLTIICLKAALLTFGTGLAIVPLLEGDLVEKFKLISHSQFLDALALGQITPGPVVITVTWLGYKILAWKGALIATMAVFLPGFFMSLFVIPFIQKKWGQSVLMSQFYRFAVPAVVGAMFSVLMRLCFQNLRTSETLAIFISSLVLVFWRKTPSWFVIPLFGFIAIFLKVF